MTEKLTFAIEPCAHLRPQLGDTLNACRAGFLLQPSLWTVTDEVLPDGKPEGWGIADYAALTKLAFLSSFEEELPLLSSRYAEVFGTDRVEGAVFDRFWEIREVPAVDTKGLSVQWYLMWLPDAPRRGPSGSDLVDRGLDEGTLAAR